MSPLIPILSGLIQLGDKFIEDKDKKTEFAFKTQELAFKTMETLLNAKTYPWVDALVKLLYAMQTFWRPLLGAAMTAFGAYCHWKGIDMGNAHMIFDAAFPAWGVSRHVEKQKKIKQETDWDF